MSAELYDAEMAGALARPAIDVLPTHHARKGKAEEPVPAPSSDAPADQAPSDAPDEAPAAPDFGLPVPDAFAAPADLPAPAVELAPEAEAPAPRKVFGMALTRSRKAKTVEGTEDAPEAEAFETPSDVEATPEAIVSATEDTIEPLFIEPVAEAADVTETAADAPTEIVALAPSMPDHTEEVRAMRALLEASEQVRQAAEARTATAEAQLRTVTNTVQEWQIRHREAEATITELAASLAGAEGRMAELHQQLSAAQAERDELTAQLDAATSPATS